MGKSWNYFFFSFFFEFFLQEFLQNTDWLFWLEHVLHVRQVSLFSTVNIDLLVKIQVQLN